MKVLTPIDLKAVRHDSNSTVVASTSSTTIYSVPASTFRAMKISIVTSSGTEYCARELLALHDDVDGYITEYAIVSTPGASFIENDVFSATVNSGNFLLTITPTSTTTRDISLTINLL